MKKRKSAERTERRVLQSGASSFGKAMIVGVGTGLAVWLLLLLVVSYFISGTGDPGGLIVPAVFVLAACASLAAGIAVNKILRRNPLIAGLLTGGVLLLVVWIISLISAGSESEAVSMPLKLMLGADFLLFTLLGTKLGFRTKKVRRPVRR